MLSDSLYPYETDRTLDGKTALTKGTNVRLRAGSSTTSSILATIATSGSVAGRLTGRYTVDGSYKWYELENTPANKNAWIRNDLVTITGTATSVTPAAKNPDEEAQTVMDSITKQDTETLNNLNQAAGMIEALKAKGVSTTTSANKLTDIFKRLQERQEALQKSTWGKVKDKISSGWDTVKKFFGFGGVNGHLGILPIVVVAIVAVAAGAGTSALVILKPWKSKSDIDLKESKELKELLDKADPVVAQKIRTDLKEQLVDTYNLAERRTNVANTLNIGKYALFAALIIGGMVFFQKNVLNKM